MSPKPVIPFRQRLLEDMAVRHFSEKSTHDYVRHIDRFLAFLGRPPETATADDLRDFQVHLNQGGVRPASFNSAVSALRFFFCTTLGQPGLGHQLARVHYPRKLPRVLSPEEVMRLLEAAPGPGLKYKAALSVAYGAGLRALEVCMLRVSDIDSKRMLIRVELGKGGKDRFAMLSPQLLELLRAWWRQCRSKGWLFPGKDPLLPLTARQLNRACHLAAEAADLAARGTRLRPERGDRARTLRDCRGRDRAGLARPRLAVETARVGTVGARTARRPRQRRACALPQDPLPPSDRPPRRVRALARKFRSRTTATCIKSGPRAGHCRHCNEAAADQSGTRRAGEGQTCRRRSSHPFARG